MAVIGAGFGDEGKGRVVDFLCSRAKDPLVVRFSGGPQAAHRVQLEDGRSHVFAHFGSGTFRGAPTYWTHYCPVNPYSLLKEYGVLRSKGVRPRIYIDSRCPLITPYEIEQNDFRRAQHGTCGMGIYETMQREKDNYHLLVEDLEEPSVFRKKMQQLDWYYEHNCDGDQLDLFYNATTAFFGSGDPELAEDIRIVDGETQSIKIAGNTVIFEGSQGLLLDQNIGFFPNVTPSNTGTKNILEMGFKNFQVVLVTRAYQTRHGNGPMAAEIPHDIPSNPCEENYDNGPQGKFRTGLIDLDMLRYAVKKDPYLRCRQPVVVVTCLDLVEKDHRFVNRGNKILAESPMSLMERIGKTVNAKFVLGSTSPSGDMIGQEQITPGLQP
jgi:adenylosuccinate synthase